MKWFPNHWRDRARLFQDKAQPLYIGRLICIQGDFHKRCNLGRRHRASLIAEFGHQGLQILGALVQSSENSNALQIGLHDTTFDGVFVNPHIQTRRPVYFQQARQSFRVAQSVERESRRERGWMSAG